MAPDAKRTLAILPAFNEAESIAPIISEIQLRNPDIDILVVDDGSQDGTASITRALGIKTISLPFNMGVGGAMRLGYKYASLSRYDYAIQVDADGQHNPADIQRLIEALWNADICIGARFAGQGEYRVRGTRWIAMRLLSLLMSKAIGVKLTDTTSGFRAANGVAIEFFAENYPVEYLGDTIDVLISAHKSGLRITQIPVAMRVRQAGEPSQNWRKSAAHLLRSLVSFFIALTKPAANRGVVK